mgnify:CR=1 FL=1|tara:strand:+ start:887 stop:1264 length:378 start_codon:yes stop_codon:yes gene_type:complete
MVLGVKMNKHEMKMTEEMKMTDYVEVTTISTFRIRYMMRKDDLRALNTAVDPTDDELTEWAIQQTRTDTAIDEFSQVWLGEQIVSTRECTEDEMVIAFDRDNDYLKEWTRDAKIRWVRTSLNKNA